MTTEIIFDIETKKLFEEIDGFDPSALGVSIVSLYKRKLDDQGKELTGEMMSFWDTEIPKMWSHFTNVDRVIGYNSLKFDVPALAPLCPYDFRKIPHFDMLDHIKQKLGFRIGLGAVAAQTIRHTKSDVGTNAVLYWLEHTPESLQKLKSYCEMDVLVTKEVYDFGRSHRSLSFIDKWNTLRTVEVDFSYPPVNTPQEQMGLF